MIAAVRQITVGSRATTAVCQCVALFSAMFAAMFLSDASGSDRQIFISPSAIISLRAACHYYPIRTLRMSDFLMLQPKKFAHVSLPESQ